MKRLNSVGPASVLAMSAIILLAAPARSGYGDLVNPGFVPNAPAIEADFANLSYNASTKVFDVSVNDPNLLTYFTQQFFPLGGFFDPAVPASLDINLLVDNNGNFKANGLGITLTGAIDVDGDGIDDVSGTLLNGTVTAFGSQTAGPPTRSFDGLFDITGGLLSQTIDLSTGGTLFGGFPVGATGGFLLAAENVTSGILGNFAASFSSDSVKVDPISTVVPEPGGLVLVLSGIVILCGHRLLRLLGFS
jgi:hypothetical protein